MTNETESLGQPDGQEQGERWAYREHQGYPDQWVLTSDGQAEYGPIPFEGTRDGLLQLLNALTADLATARRELEEARAEVRRLRHVTTFRGNLYNERAYWQARTQTVEAENADLRARVKVLEGKAALAERARAYSKLWRGFSNEDDGFWEAFDADFDALTATPASTGGE